MPNGKSDSSSVFAVERKKLKTFTFAGGTVSPGFVLTDGERNKSLALGEYGRRSWLTNVPLNNNPDNCPEVDNNIVQDCFLLNVGGEKDFFILSRDRSSQNGSCLIRFLTVGEGGKGNGYVNRISGWRSKELVDGHGRNNGVIPDNGTWTDSVWVVQEGELLKVQIAGCDTAFAVRVKNGEPTVEPWIEHAPRQQSAEPAKTEPKPVSVSGNGKGGNPHRTMRNLKGSHVVPVVEWSPSPEGVNDAPEPKINLDAELARIGQDRVAKFNAKFQRA